MKQLAARVTSKGQVTLPKELRESMGIGKGDRILFSIDSPYEVRLGREVVPGASAGVMRHLARNRTEAATSGEMAVAVKAAAVAKFERKTGSR